MKTALIVFFSLFFLGCGSDETASGKQESSQTMSQKTVSTTQEVVSSTVVVKNSNLVYTKCISCHGAKAEKKALNKSQIIAGWNASKIEKALKGYKNGSYGGALKGMMKAQVMSMSDRDIKSVAEYISSL